MDSFHYLQTNMNMVETHKKQKVLFIKRQAQRSVKTPISRGTHLVLFIQGLPVKGNASVTLNTHDPHSEISTTSRQVT